MSDDNSETYRLRAERAEEALATVRACLRHIEVEAGDLTDANDVERQFILGLCNDLRTEIGADHD